MNVAQSRWGRAVGAVGLVIVWAVGGGLAVTPRALAQDAGAAVQPAGPQAGAEAKAGADLPISRAVWNDAGDEVQLEIVTRTLRPAGGGPTVLLVGAVHVGEADYYAELQKILDASEIVLFEGVKPSGLGDLPSKEDAAACIEMTKSHLKLAGAVIGKVSEKGPPATREEILARAKWPAADVVKSVLRDGWGRDMVYVVAADGKSFDVISLGADGKEGGEGEDADLRMSDDPTPLKKDRGVNLQQKLAKALGLTYQLEGINYDRKHFRNSDLSIDEVERLLKQAGGGAEEILRMLSGESMMAKFAGLALGLVERIPSMRAMTKVMITQVLSDASEDAMGKLPAGKAMQKVIIEDRNAAVYRDLEALVKERPDAKTIAIFYGAGHFPTMQAELLKRGYTIDEKADRWIPAIRASLEGTGMTRRQLEGMVKTMMPKK